MREKTKAVAAKVPAKKAPRVKATNDELTAKAVIEEEVILHDDAFDVDLDNLSAFAEEVELQLEATKPHYTIQTVCMTCGKTTIIGQLGEADGIQAIVTPGKPLELACKHCGAHLALEVEAIKD